MAKTKKLHPADIADREAIAGAVSFNVHLRRSPTSKVNAEAGTLAEAVKHFDALTAEDANRRPIIYAILANGVTIPVPRDMIYAVGAAEAAKAALAENPREIVAAPVDDLPGEPLEIPAFVRRGIEAKAKVDISDAGPADAEGAVSIRDLHKIKHPVAEANAASWPGKAKRKAKAEAPKAEKPAAEAKAPTGKRAAVLEAAKAGTIPEAPDFSAETHARFRKKLAEIVAMVEAGNIEGLKAFPINPVSSSPKAMAKYRDLAVIALEARAAKKEAA